MRNIEFLKTLKVEVGSLKEMKNFSIYMQDTKNPTEAGSLKDFINYFFRSSILQQIIIDNTQAIQAKNVTKLSECILFFVRSARIDTITNAIGKYHFIFSTPFEFVSIVCQITYADLSIQRTL